MGIIKDESAKVYGNWKVLTYLGKPKTTNGSDWRCECICCKNCVTIRGANLRRNKLPICRNCCSKCGRTKQQVQIKKGTICGSCRSEFISNWRKNNAEQIRKTHTEWIKNNKDKIINRRKRSTARRESSHTLFLSRMLKQKVNYYNSLIKSGTKTHRSRQKLNNLHRYMITITEPELISLWISQNGTCVITKLPMTTKYNDINSVSIDRIDQNHGYTIDNIQLVCRWINFAKNVFTNIQIKQVLLDFKNLK